MKRKKKVPVVLQMEAVECGAASLAMVLGYHGRYIPLEKVRIDCNVTRDGSTAKYILKAAARHGLVGKGYKMSAQRLRECTDFPMILHWNFNHFVVLCGFKKDKAVIHDPASGRVLVEKEVFERSFTGVVLRFQTGEDFCPEGKPGGVWRFVRDRLARIGGQLSFVVVMRFVYAVFTLMPPVFYKIFTDQILIGNASSWMRPLMAAMMAAGVIGLLSGCLKDIVLARFKARFRIRSASSFMWKVLRLPVQFFSQRFSGDIVSRADDNEEIAAQLFDKVIPDLMDTFFIFFMFLVMLYFDVPMALVMFCAGLVQIALILFVSLGNGNIARNIGRDSGKMSGAMLSGISMMETVKASGAEAGTVEKIVGYQTKYQNSSLALVRNKLYLDILPPLLSGLCNALILILGIHAIFQGRQTVGMLAAFQSFLQIYFQPLGALTEGIQTVQEMAGSMERIEDVMAYEEDITEKALFSEDQGGVRCLRGEIALDHVTFGYSPVTEPLIRDFSLHAEPGQMIALAGGSGSGKSTVAKLLCGLYQSRSGEVLFDGCPIQQIDHYVFTRSVAVVDQEISLFAGTIQDNITMWDPDIQEEDVIRACKDACIHDDIMLRKDGYQYQVHEGGSDFSGGQRQRIEIARALAAGPSVLVMDEATSALDAMTEKSIMDAVRRRNITCFIIAHRLSAIRDADEIIMLQHGEIVERGTHGELMALDGVYASLVRSD